mmetsp:Transcript_21104/g.47857  ORF Transcript_21104/g.47857 Transcript_21104/m.47857 type:complete len:192 (-) Transcript_21104:226-801(-)
MIIIHKMMLLRLTSVWFTILISKNVVWGETQEAVVNSAYKLSAALNRNVDSIESVESGIRILKQVKKDVKDPINETKAQKITVQSKQKNDKKEKRKRHQKTNGKTFAGRSEKKKKKKKKTTWVPTLMGRSRKLPPGAKKRKKRDKLIMAPKKEEFTTPKMTIKSKTYKGFEDVFSTENESKKNISYNSQKQ